MVTAQHYSGQISLERAVAVVVSAIGTTPKDAAFGHISTGRVAKNISDYRSAGARERFEDVGAQPRGHHADIDVQRDVGGRRAGIVAGVICIKGHGDFGSTGISQGGSTQKRPRDENGEHCYAQSQRQKIVIRKWCTEDSHYRA